MEHKKSPDIPPDLMRLMVYPVQSFPVTVGAGLGEGLGDPDDACPGDILELKRGAVSAELVVQKTTLGASCVSSQSMIGVPGEAVHMVAHYTLLNNRGQRVAVLLLSTGQNDFVLPLDSLSSGGQYTLLEAKPLNSEEILHTKASVSFTPGTHITMEDGTQLPVERLNPGDRVLTRDHGPQPLRWIGRQRANAEGARALVFVTKGALNNAADLLLSPDHRLFIYQREDVIDAGQAELLIRARYLVNNDTIYLREQSTVDYIHLLFDRHEIIYIEGIPAESLNTSKEALSGLNDNLLIEVLKTIDGNLQEQSIGIEPTQRELGLKDAAQRLKRATEG